MFIWIYGLMEIDEGFDLNQVVIKINRVILISYFNIILKER